MQIGLVQFLEAGDAQQPQAADHLIFEQFENGQFTVLSALGVVMVLTLVLLVTVAYKLGAKVGLKQD